MCGSSALLSERALAMCESSASPFGGSPRIHAGEERFSAPEGVSLTIMRFSAGLREIPGLKTARAVPLRIL
jgi:hypothetical protein